MDIKNVKDARRYFNSIKSTAESVAMSWSVVFFRSPITKTIESRTIMSDSNAEVRIWADHVTEFYKSAGIAFSSYLNGSFYSHSDEDVF